MQVNTVDKAKEQAKEHINNVSNTRTKKHEKKHEKKRGRLSVNLDEKTREELIFEEVSRLDEDITKQSKKNSLWSNFFSYLNPLLNLIVILCSGATVVISAIFNPASAPNIVAIVLGGVIFVITTSSELFKLGPRGYHYLQSSIRLRRIHNQMTNIKYNFHNFSAQEILIMLANIRSEVDEISLELYKKSMIGEVKFDGGNNHLSVEDSRDSHDRSHEDSSPHSSPHLTHHSNESHITIHIDSSPTLTTPTQHEKNKSEINIKIAENPENPDEPLE